MNKIKIPEDPVVDLLYQKPIIHSDADTCDDFIKDVCKRIDKGEITDIDKFLDRLRNSSSYSFSGMRYTVLI